MSSIFYNEVKSLDYDFSSINVGDLNNLKKVKSMTPIIALLILWVIKDFF